MKIRLYAAACNRLLFLFIGRMADILLTVSNERPTRLLSLINLDILSIKRYNKTIELCNLMALLDLKGCLHGKNY